MAMVSPLRQQRDYDRKENTRQDLLNAAIDVFYDKGYHRSLISDIVARAGVGQGTFYRHFKSKRDLIDAIMDRFGQMLLSQFEFMTVNLPSNADEYRDASMNAVMAMAVLAEKNRKLALLLREAPTVDREFEQRTNDLYDQLAGLAAFYLDHAVSQGFARPCNTAIVSQAIVGMGLRHMTMWLNDEHNAVDIHKLITELVDFAFLGFGA
ncbi:MAG: TetR/AcrR family transcriptional regulator [Candidatus Alcyoniella australis]|nr:TetR/AcrR family transcriptional regulator [Candidatus Alcyoniella australis]